MTSIEIPAEAMEGMVTKVLLESLTPQARDSIIEQAVLSMLKPEKTFGRTAEKTPLQQAFENAIGVAAQRAVNTYVAEHPEIMQRLDEAMGALARGLLDATGDYDIPDQVGQAVGAALANHIREAGSSRY